jgi:menaquinone-specific isochorismate synthase
MSEPRPIAVVLPAPRSAPEKLLELFPREPAVLWAPPRGPALAGVGAAVRFDVGRGGLRALRARAQSWLARVVVIGAPPGVARTPRLFGGFAFDPGMPAGARWRGFGAGTFLVPRWTYVRDGRGAWLMLAAPTAAALRSPRLRAECGAVERVLVGERSARRRAAVARVEHDRADGFSDAFAAALEGIASGRLEKVVLARRLELRAREAFDVPAVVRHLSAVQPRAWRFAMRLEGATFLGASPERLVKRSGTRVDADALAGSARTGGRRARALRSSAKELGEHRWVVRAIREALAPHCRIVRHLRRPSVRPLPGIRHLWTPIRGELRDGTHVLDLAATLHPTPAVGGFPRGAALRFLRRHEAPRGWYAGAFGWFDGAGDGEFAVAIRSGLLRGRRADLFAGAGVVAGSSAAAELDEIDGKLGTMASALGVECR